MSEESTELSDYCKDLGQWPVSWAGFDKDIPYGNDIMEVFKPFLMHLISKGLSRRTIKTHIDNLWLLGGELIREINMNESMRKISARKLIVNSIGVDGGPYCRHLDSEEDMRSFDSTCKTLHKYLRNNK